MGRNNLIILKPLPASSAALLTGEKAVGAVIGSGGGTHYDLLKDLDPYLSDRGALLALLLVLLGLVIAGPLGCFGANFCPGPSMGVLGLARQR